MKGNVTQLKMLCDIFGQGGGFTCRAKTPIQSPQDREARIQKAKVRRDKRLAKSRKVNHKLISRRSHGN